MPWAEFRLTHRQIPESQATNLRFRGPFHDRKRPLMWEPPPGIEPGTDVISTQAGASQADLNWARCPGPGPVSDPWPGLHAGRAVDSLAEQVGVPVGRLSRQQDDSGPSVM